MLKPKDIGDKTVPSSAPLFKFGDTGDYTRGLFIAVLVSVFIVAALYVAGVMFHNSGLTLLAFAVGIVAIIVIIWVHRRNRLERSQMSAKEIDAAVERYKQDLVDTYIGYDVEYSVEDVLEAADKYREALETEEASVFDLDPATLLKVAGETFGSSSKSKESESEGTPANSAEEENEG